MNETAGANIDDASGEMNVMLARSEMRNHFLLSGKFKGISGSSWDSQPTIPWSRSETGSGGGSRRFFLLREEMLVAMRERRLRELDLVFTRWISSGPFCVGACLIDAKVWGGGS